MKPIPDYLLIGHMTADLTPDGRILGGTVSYAARVVKAFGLRVGVITSAMPEEPLVAELQPYVDEMVMIPGQSTSTFENIYRPEGRVQYIRGVAASLRAAHVPEAWRSTPLVHLAPLTNEVDPLLARCFPESTILLTLQGWLRRWDDDGRVHFKRWHDAEILKDIDIVVFSEEDICEAPDLEAEFARSVRHLFVTRAEKGGTYYRDGQPIVYDTPQVELVHPTGAGDVFASGLLAGLHVLKGNMQAAIHVAARLAATSVTRFGLEGAPTADEVRAALSEVEGLADYRADSLQR